MCCSGKQALNESAEVVKLCVRIMDDKCESEEWNEEKLVNHLKNKLIKSYSQDKVTDETYLKDCDEIISHGIFSEIVISKLLKNGMSKDDIIKVMKYGLESLQIYQLNCFNIFNVNEETMNCSNTSLNNASEELIEKLKSVGFSDEESSDIILKGLAYQSECYAFRLTSHNIFAAKILNWQGPITPATTSIIEFLEHLGIDDYTLKIVSEKGVSAEAREIIKDLGYDEANQQRCSKILQQPSCDCTNNSDSSNSTSFENECISRSTRSQELYERKTFIRNNLMAPLTWAMSETLKYNPTDPVHYLACQLLRWKHNNVDPTQMKEVVDFVNNATANE